MGYQWEQGGERKAEKGRKEKRQTMKIKTSLKRAAFAEIATNA